MKRLIVLFSLLTLVLTLGIVAVYAENSITLDKNTCVMDYEAREIVDPIWATVKTENESGKDWMGIYPADVDLSMCPEKGPATLNHWIYLETGTQDYPEVFEDCAKENLWDLSIETMKRKTGYTGYDPETFDLEPGTYVVIVFENDGYNILAKSEEFTIVDKADVPVVTKAPETPTEEPAAATEEPAEATEAPAEATEAPAEATEAPAEATPEAKEEKGCNSVIGAGAVVVLAAALIVCRKKDND